MQMQSELCSLQSRSQLWPCSWCLPPLIPMVDMRPALSYSSFCVSKLWISSSSHSLGLLSLSLPSWLHQLHVQEGGGINTPKLLLSLRLGSPYCNCDLGGTGGIMNCRVRKQCNTVPFQCQISMSWLTHLSKAEAWLTQEPENARKSPILQHKFLVNRNKLFL